MFDETSKELDFRMEDTIHKVTKPDACYCRKHGLQRYSVILLGGEWWSNCSICIQESSVIQTPTTKVGTPESCICEFETCMNEAPMENFCVACHDLFCIAHMGSDSLCIVCLEREDARE
jgi:hypothetical protein